MHPTLATIVFLGVIYFGVQAINANALQITPNDESSQKKSNEPWYLSFYRGQFTDTNLKNILLEAKTEYKPSFVNVTSLARPLKYTPFGFDTEGEGQFAYHEGMMKHLEFNALFILRTQEFSRNFPVRLGFGEGLSLASRNPELENKRKSALSPNTESEYSNKFLNYLMIEMDIAMPIDSYEPRAFIRIHHRSGVYGLFCPPTCGSNFIAYGMKFRF